MHQTVKWQIGCGQFIKNLVDKAEEFKLYFEITENGMTTFIF